MGQNKIIRKCIILIGIAGIFAIFFLLSGVIDIFDRYQYGYIDKQGKIVLRAQFAGAHPFSEGLAAVKIDGKWGFINKSGEVVIPPKFGRAFGDGVPSPFSHGIAATLLNTTPVMITRTGSIHLKLEEFDQVGNFSEGLAIVKKDKKVGYINQTGKLVIDLLYFGAVDPTETTRDFSEGLAVISDSSGKYGFINHSGTICIAPKFESASRFCEGLAAVEVDEKYGYIDTTGTMVIPPRFDHALDFSEGLACVGVSTGKYETRYGYINHEGKFIIPVQYRRARTFSDGVARIQLPDWDADTYGFIDKTGQIVIKPSFFVYRPGDFSEGLAVFCNQPSGKL